MRTERAPPLPNQRLIREAWRPLRQQRTPMTDAGGSGGGQRCGRQLRRTPPHPHLPDKQQDEAVQAPLEGAEAHALDAHQLVGLVLAQGGGAAARHDRLRANSDGRGRWGGGGREEREETSDSFLRSSPSCVDGHMSRLLQLLSTFQHPPTHRHM